LKHLFKNDAEEFEAEAVALKRFNGFGNPHMVTLLMSWELNEQYYLLFPLASCDLDEYWKENPLPILDDKMIRWTSKQIVGIASAVRAIHDPPENSLKVDEDHQYGRHGDLKPENILLYESPTDNMGILVVADLGLSKLNSILSRSAQTSSRIPFTPRYKPPECDIQHERVTRSYDVWTFGCILLEWVTWLFQGHYARQQFLDDLLSPYASGSQADMFFDMQVTAGKGHQVIMKANVLEVSPSQSSSRGIG
jgi:serine/threonine protein kinase